MYAAYKVSQYTHKYRVDETDGPARAQTKDAVISQLEADSDLDYKKKHRLGKNKEGPKEEFKSTRDALKEFSPWQWRKQLDYIKGLTPEEYESVLYSLNHLKYNCKVYAIFFAGLGLTFSFWQRMFLPKSFYMFAFISGISAGCIYGAIKTSWFFVDKLDSLGRDYELSRMIKQDIFDTRSDLDPGLRAQFYMNQQKQHDQFEDKYGK